MLMDSFQIMTKAFVELNFLYKTKPKNLLSINYIRRLEVDRQKLQKYTILLKSDRSVMWVLDIIFNLIGIGFICAAVFHWQL